MCQPAVGHDVDPGGAVFAPHEDARFLDAPYAGNDAGRAHRPGDRVARIPVRVSATGIRDTQCDTGHAGHTSGFSATAGRTGYQSDCPAIVHASGKNSITFG